MTEMHAIFCDGPDCEKRVAASQKAGTKPGNGWIAVTLNLMGWNNAHQSGHFCSEACVLKWVTSEALPTAISGATPERTPK